MAGWGWQSVHDPEVLPKVLENWQGAITNGRTFEMTFPLRGEDGIFRRFLTRVTPLKDSDGQVTRWFGTNTDVEAERTAREAAEEANQAKTDFLATMSHELRTPLNAIGGYAELLDLGIHGPVTEPQREAISRIQRSQRHLLGLINDVLNFAKLEQILVNLLSNAIKFTAPGGTVTLSCQAEGEAILIAVADTGVGIAPDRVDQIFAPFVQIDRRLTSPHEGTGLGLSISRDLARAMGGDLTVESEVGGGSTFTLALPRA